MSYVQECPFCGQRIEVSEEMDGQTANCPACDAEVYFSREDAAADAQVNRIRQESAERDREHMNELRMVAMMQEQRRQQEAHTRRVISTLLWIFVWGPLILFGVGLFLYVMLSILNG